MTKQHRHAHFRPHEVGFEGSDCLPSRVISDEFSGSSRELNLIEGCLARTVMWRCTNGLLGAAKCLLHSRKIVATRLSIEMRRLNAHPLLWLVF
jgi:hypothetical protein